MRNPSKYMSIQIPLMSLISDGTTKHDACASMKENRTFGKKHKRLGLLSKYSNALNRSNTGGCS